MMTKTTSICVLTAIAFLLLTVDAQADGCPNVANMRLTAKQNHLSLNDNAPVCVTLEEDGSVDFTFKITIANPIEVNTNDVTVVQKGDDPDPDFTIEGTNESPTNKVTIRVRGNANEEDIFEYYIKVEGIGILDPTVRVVGSNPQMMLQVQALEDVADAWDLSLEELIRLSKYSQELE